MIGLLGKGLNLTGWNRITPVLTTYELAYSHVSSHTDISSSFDLVISCGYARIIPSNYLSAPKNGLVVFHSSDLPEGRGWAPLFYTIMLKKKRLTQTLFYATEDVDAGPIIAKAHYPIDDCMHIGTLRKIDDELTCMLLKETVQDLAAHRVAAVEQDHGAATYWKKRVPSDSRIDPSSNVAELFDLMRALPAEYAAYFQRDGKTFRIKLQREDELNFDSEKISFQKYYE